MAAIVLSASAPRAAVDDKRPFAPHLHDDVAFVARQQVDVPAEGQT